MALHAGGWRRPAADVTRAFPATGTEEIIEAWPARLSVVSALSTIALPATNRVLAHYLTVDVIGPRGVDDELVQRVCAGDLSAFEALMRRHNQRLFRAARAVLGEDAEAEDVVQDAYAKAYCALPTGYRPGQFGGWVLAIVLNEARSRRRKSRRREVLLQQNESIAGGDAAERSTVDPEDAVAGLELRRAVEQAIDGLPSDQRIVFVLRELEQMSTKETAALVGLTETAVRTRLHRSKAVLREVLSERIGRELAEAFSFAGARCDRIVSRVLKALQRRPDLAH